MDNGTNDACIGCRCVHTMDCEDYDGDGYNITGGICGPIDCDDNDTLTYPGAPELCDGKDNDCDGQIPNEDDNDEDGLLACEDNCPQVYNPDQADADFDGIGDACENECEDGLDNDGDGYIDYPDDPGCGSSDDDSEDNNDAPIIISDPVDNFRPQDERFCSLYRYDVDAIDPNGDSIMYSLIKAPVGMTIDSNTGLIEWEPKKTGTYEIEVRASDGLLHDTQKYILSVMNARKDTLPRQKFLINSIRTNHLVYDEVDAGDILFVDLRFENIGRRNVKYATIRVTVPELGISRKLGPFRGPDIEEAMSRGVMLEIPEYAPAGVYSIRISLSDLSGIRRTRYRDFRVTT